MKSSKSVKKSSSILNSLRIQKQLTNNTLRNIVIGILTGLVIYYLLKDVNVSHWFNNLVSGNKSKPDYSLNNNDKQNVVNGDKTIDTTDNFANVIEGFDEGEKHVSELTDDDKQKLCGPVNNTIQGFRSLYSGATFKLERVNPTTDNDGFYLHGPPHKVVEVSGNNTLTLQLKNNNKDKQTFTLNTTKYNEQDCVTFKYGNDLALQYEHEHLSLRPLQQNNTPFMGQCFVRYESTLEELESGALALGISVARLGNEDLQGAGHNMVVAGGEVPARVQEEKEVAQSLDQLTESKVKKVFTDVLANYKGLQQQTQGVQPGTLNNPFANKAVTVNLNLSGLEEESESFTDVSNNDSLSVRQLLDRYTNAHKSSSALASQNVSGLSENKHSQDTTNVRNTLRNKNNTFGGCPNLDRSKYYTERQLAQCAGCAPDNFLKGEL